MKKILFGITSLTLGGAERVLIDLANKLCDRFDITIFTIYPNGDLEKQLDKKIKLKTLYTKTYLELSTIQRKLIAPLNVLFNKKLIYNKKVKEHYDIEIAFLEGPITRLFSTKNKNTRKIAWVHNDISCVFGNGLKAKLKKIIDKKVYSKYETLVFVSKDNLTKFNSVYGKLVNKFGEEINKKVIYNYIDKDVIIKKAEEKKESEFNKNGLHFLTVARLVQQKGIDRLIEVHRKLIKEGFAHNFYVIGEGPEKERLQELIQQCKVENTFKLLGKKENPYPYIKNADYFCLLSHFEGYGMVIEEAKILDKPIIITDTAAREAVENYEKAVVVENTEQGIYETIKEIIENKKDFSKQEKINYSNNEIIQTVVELLEK